MIGRSRARVLEWAGSHWLTPGGLKRRARIGQGRVETGEFPMVPLSLDGLLCVLNKHSLARDSVFFGCVLPENFPLALTRHPSCCLPRVSTLIPVGRIN